MTPPRPEPSRGVLAWPARHPWLTLAIMVACLAASAWSVHRSRISSALESMLNSRDPSTQALASVMADFASVDDLLVMASLPEAAPTQPSPGAPPSMSPTPGAATGADDAGVARLEDFVHRFQQALHDSPEAGPLCQQVTIGNDPQDERFVERELVPSGLYYLDDQEFAALCRRLQPEEIQRQIDQDEAMMAAPGPAGALADTLLRDPLRLREFLLHHLAAMRPPLKTLPGASELISADGRHALVLIRGVEGPNDLEFAKRLTRAVRGVANQVNRDGLEIDFAGSYAIAAFAEHSIRTDMILNLTSSLLAIQVLFWLAYRGPWSFALTIAPTIVGIVVGFGLFALFTPSFNPLTAAIGGILAGLGIDYPIYYLAHYRRQRGEVGAAPSAAPSAARRTAVLVGPAICSACATSIAGFSSIGLSDVPALRQFALLGALGLAASLLTSLTVLPAALRLLEGSGGRVPGGQPRFDPGRYLAALQRHSGAWALGMALAFAVSLAVLGVGVWRASWFETDIGVMHPQPNPPLEAQARIGEVFGIPPTTMIVHLRAANPRDLLALAHDAQRRIAASGVLDHGAGWMIGPATFLPDPAATASRAAAIHAFDIDAAVAHLRTAIAASVFAPSVGDDYAKLLRRLFADPATHPPPGLPELARYPALGDRFLPKAAFGSGAPGGAAALTQAVALVNLHDPLTNHAARVATIAALRRALDGLGGARLTGLTVVAADTEVAVRRDLWKFLGLGATLIVLWLLVHFRHLGRTLLALLPVSFGLAVMLGYMAATGDRFNMVNLLSVPLLLGCGVDYGLFLVTLAEAGRRRGAPPAAALDELAATCHAIVLANLASVLGFGGLVTCGTPALRSLGRVAGLGMLACLAGTLLLLLPLLLRGWGMERKPETRNPKPE